MGLYRLVNVPSEKSGLYDKASKAKAIVTKYGQGSVHEAFVDLGMHPIYVVPIAPKQQPKGKVPYGD